MKKSGICASVPNVLPATKVMQYVLSPHRFAQRKCPIFLYVCPLLPQTRLYSGVTGQLFMQPSNCLVSGVDDVIGSVVSEEEMSVIGETVEGVPLLHGPSYDNLISTQICY